MELPACALAFVIFSVWFPAIGGNIVTLSPSPEAKVTEGDNLKLQCIYSGSFTPDTVNWYLNNDTLGFVLLASDCSEASVPPLYGSGRYNKTCSIPSFSLLIQNVTISMDGDIWSCDTTSFGNSPPSKVSTTIKVQRTTTIPSSTVTATESAPSTNMSQTTENGTSLQTEESGKDVIQIIIISVSVSGGITLLGVGVTVIIIIRYRRQKKAADEVVDAKDRNDGQESPYPRYIVGQEGNDFMESNPNNGNSSEQINFASNRTSIPLQAGKAIPPAK